MIIDVHTHPPQYKDAVPDDQVVWNNVWRPDRAVRATTSWGDYLDAQRPADISIVFAIAWQPGMAVPRISADEAGDTSWYRGNINDAVATFVAAHPDRLIGF